MSNFEFSTDSWQPTRAEDLEAIGVSPERAAEVIENASVDTEPPDLVSDLTNEEIESGL